MMLPLLEHAVLNGSASANYFHEHDFSENHPAVTRRLTNKSFAIDDFPRLDTARGIGDANVGSLHVVAILPLPEHLKQPLKHLRWLEWP